MPHILIYDCQSGDELRRMRTAVVEAIGATHVVSQCDARLVEGTDSYVAGSSSTLLTVAPTVISAAHEHLAREHGKPQI